MQLYLSKKNQHLVEPYTQFIL